MVLETGMNLVWKGRQKKVVVVGQGCSAKRLYTHAVKNGAQVVTVPDVRKWTDNFISKDISESHLVMVCDKRSSNLNRISELCQQSKSLLFVLGDFDSSDVWIEDISDCQCTCLKEASSEDEGYRSNERLNRRGEIFLVGAGPGDPGLLTWHARRVLQRAHVVLADKLIPKEILAFVRGELRIAAKYPGNANQAQEELNAWGARALKQGRTVVRLKGGDPFIFGRGGEEVLFYRNIGFEPTVVPGISSLLGGPLLASIPVTHRGIADQVLFATGRRQDDAIPSLPKYTSTRTLVLAMALHRVDAILDDLEALDYPKSLPVAIIERASCPDTRTLTTQLGSLSGLVKVEPIRQPALLVIGNTVTALNTISLQSPTL